MAAVPPLPGRGCCRRNPPTEQGRSPRRGEPFSSKRFSSAGWVGSDELETGRRWAGGCREAAPCQSLQIQSKRQPKRAGSPTAVTHSMVPAGRYCARGFRGSPRAGTAYPEVCGRQHARRRPATREVAGLQDTAGNTLGSHECRTGHVNPPRRPADVRPFSSMRATCQITVVNGMSAEFTHGGGCQRLGASPGCSPPFAGYRRQARR